MKKFPFNNNLKQQNDYGKDYQHEESAQGRQGGLWRE